MAPELTQKSVDDAIARLGNYRVRRIQKVALEGEPDGISGALLLAFGLRETGLQNIIGGLRRDEEGHWIPETDPARQDVGVFQISRIYHSAALRLLPGVVNGTWGPCIPFATAADAGMVPRFEDSLQFTLRMMHEHMAMAEDAGVKNLSGRVDIAIAAHNAGFAGALRGFREGSVDKYTTQQDYVTWVKAHRTKVNHALQSDRFANWRVV